MLSFYSYKNMLEYLNGSGRPVIVHLSIWTRYRKRLRFRVALDDIKGALDRSMVLSRYSDYLLRFIDVDGRRFSSQLFKMREIRVDKIEMQRKDTSDAMFFTNYAELIDYLRSHGKQIRLQFSVWTHSSKRMYFYVPLEQVEDIIDKDMMVKYLPEHEVRLQDPNGEWFVSNMGKLRIIKVDNLQIY